MRFSLGSGGFAASTGGTAPGSIPTPGIATGATASGSTGSALACGTVNVPPPNAP